MSGAGPLVVVHACRGRVRLAADPGTDVSALGDRLVAFPAARRVLSRPATGSLIVETDGDPAPFLAALEAARLLRPARPHRPPPRLADVCRVEARAADRALRRASEGTLDLSTLAALVFAAGALVQVARGNVAGPATALVLGAIGLLREAANETGADDGD